MRKLVTFRTVNKITTINGADKIVLASIDGWNCVVKKDEFNVGDKGVFFEIDSLIPATGKFSFLESKAQYKHGGDQFEIPMARIKTIKLRGVISQGLLLPINLFDDLDFTAFTDDDDLSSVFGVVKYEPYIPQCLRGNAEGVFPTFLFKSDQERCLSADVMVTTNKGDISIKEIVDNKMNVKVLSYNHENNNLEFKNIIDWSMMRNNNDWLKIVTKSGKTLICTKNHKIWSEDIQAYRNAMDLEIGQLILTKMD